MRRNIRNELIVALFAAVSILFAALFAILLSTSTQNPPLPVTPTDLPTRATRVAESVTDTATFVATQTTESAATSARREPDELTPSPSNTIASATGDIAGTPADELTATPDFNATATAIPAATDVSQSETVEFAETAAATTSVRRSTETFTPSPTAIASVTAVDSTALPADELTAEPSTAGSATAIPAATDGRRLATADVATTVAAATSLLRDTETLAPSPLFTASVVAVDSTALPADELTATTAFSATAIAIPATADSRSIGNNGIRSNRRVATADVATTVAAATSLLRDTETLAPSPTLFTASVVAVGSTALSADELTATTAFSATATAIPAATDRVRFATMEFAETAAATTSARRETETNTPSPTATATPLSQWIRLPCRLMNFHDCLQRNCDCDSQRQQTAANWQRRKSPRTAADYHVCA